MASNVHREEVLLVVLANSDIALDADSIAATYDTPVDEWRDSFRRLERKGLVEPLGDGLYALTAEGEKQVAPRGPGDQPGGDGSNVRLSASSRTA